MHNLIRAEWLKLTKRPLTLGALPVFLALMVLNLAVEFLVVALHDGAFSGGSAQIKLLPEAQVTRFRLMVTFPGIFGAVLGQVNGVGGICAVVLAAGAFGSEYNCGARCARSLRGSRCRDLYLVAKIITLHLVLLAGIAIVLLVGSLLAWLFGSLLRHLGSVDAGRAGITAAGDVRSLYVIVPYVMFTIACCTIGRWCWPVCWGIFS